MLWNYEGHIQVSHMNNFFLKVQLIAHSERVKEPEASPVCDPPKEIRQPHSEPINIINILSRLGWHTCSIRCPTALIRSNMTALVAVTWHKQYLRRSAWGPGVHLIWSST